MVLSHTLIFFFNILRVTLEVGEILFKSVFIQWMESVIKSLNLGVFFYLISVPYYKYRIASHGYEIAVVTVLPPGSVNERSGRIFENQLPWTLYPSKNKPPWSGRKEICWLAFTMVLWERGSLLAEKYPNQIGKSWKFEWKPELCLKGHMSECWEESNSSELCATDIFPLSLGQFDLILYPCNQRVVTVGNGK